EIRAVVGPDARVDEGVHADGVAGARLHAHSAVDALERVDLVAHGILLGLRVGMLARFDVDALGRARRRTEEAGRAAHRAVGLEGEPVRPAVALRIDLALV